MFVLALTLPSDRRQTCLARGSLRAGAGTVLDDIEIGPVKSASGESRQIVERLTAILGEQDEKEPVLIALDVPLGWPVAFRQLLEKHEAGAGLEGGAGAALHRKTDIYINGLIGRPLLEILPDRFASQSVFGLRLLAELRSATGRELPLLVKQGALVGDGVIEVQARATLASLGIRAKGYKKRTEQEKRGRLADNLKDFITLSDGARSKIVDSGYAFDAALNWIAAIDFLRELSHPKPSDKLPPEAAKEGWIWVRRS